MLSFVVEVKGREAFILFSASTGEDLLESAFFLVLALVVCSHEARLLK